MFFLLTLISFYKNIYLKKKVISSQKKKKHFLILYLYFVDAFLGEKINLNLHIYITITKTEKFT